MAGKWQRLIMRALENHRAFYLTDLLGAPYSLSDYNALTRAFRELAKKGKIAGFRRGGRLVAVRPQDFLRHGALPEPEDLGPEETVQSAKIGELERFAWRYHRHPRFIWRAAAFTRALDRLAELSGVSAEELAARRTVSQAACLLAAAISAHYPEAVGKVVREAWEQRRRIWFCRDLMGRVRDRVLEDKMSQYFTVGNEEGGTTMALWLPRNQC